MSPAGGGWGACSAHNPLSPTFIAEISSSSLTPSCRPPTGDPRRALSLFQQKGLQDFDALLLSDDEATLYVGVREAILALSTQDPGVLRLKNMVRRPGVKGVGWGPGGAAAGGALPPVAGTLASEPCAYVQISFRKYAGGSLYPRFPLTHSWEPVGGRPTVSIVLPHCMGGMGASTGVPEARPLGTDGWL